MSGEAPEPRFRPGARLLLLDGEGLPIEARLLRVEDGTLVVDAGKASPAPGEQVIVEHCIQGDARYRVRAQTAAAPGGGLRLLPVERWARDNQRAYVRVRTHGIDLTLSRPLDDLEPGRGRAPRKPVRYPILDVSAGGAAIRAEPQFELGEELVCHFELPGECCFALPARVVRVEEPAGGRVRGTIGLEFLGLDESLRAALLRWVFREQTRRGRPR